VVLGQPSKNPHFRRFFGDDSVTPINPDAEVSAIVSQLEQIWQQRTELSARAAVLRQKLGMQLDWSDRVKRILGFIR